MPSRCPNDGEVLVAAPRRRGLGWSCPRCSGWALGLPVARQEIDPALLRLLWQRARTGSSAASRACPDCRRSMRELPAPQGAEPLLEICTTCHLLWFDAGELESLAKLRTDPKPGSVQLSAEARRAAALMEVQAMSEVASYTTETRISETWGEWLMALLGLPMSDRMRSVPAYMTRLLIVVVAVCAGAALFDLERCISELALIPARPWRHAGLTLLTSFVLHADVFHLVGNLYFWWLFGDEVEDALGRLRYVLLLVSAALLGDVLHIAFDVRPEIPLIGASGGISGLIAYYGLRFPRARLEVPIRLIWVRMRASYWIGFWIIVQLLGAVYQLAGVSAVSALGHLGGALAGLFWWLATRPRGGSPLG
jgi:membrane associated rhomboid family serine protease/Zn-finger nucleic acid-binding protein